MVVENQRLIKQPSCIIRKQRCGNKAKKLALILIPRFIVLETCKGRIIRIDRFFVIVDIIFVLQLAHLGTDGISAALVQLVIMCFLL